MERYDYEEAVKRDVRNWLAENDFDLDEYKDRDDAIEDLECILWAEDSVTGNGSGSYTFSTYKAEEYLCHNWDLLAEALYEFGENGTNVLDRGAEACDVTIRCYLLRDAIDAVVDMRWEHEE